MHVRTAPVQDTSARLEQRQRLRPFAWRGRLLRYIISLYFSNESLSALTTSLASTISKPRRENSANTEHSLEGTPRWTNGLFTNDEKRLMNLAEKSCRPVIEG